MGAAVSAQAPDAQVMVPIQKFIDSFNKGDAASASATHAAVAELAIVDEVPPYVWRGAQAFKAWSGDLEANDKKAGITDQESRRAAIRLMSSCRPSTPSSRVA
jgi:hypothetical protein